MYDSLPAFRGRLPIHGKTGPHSMAEGVRLWGTVSTRLPNLTEALCVYVNANSSCAPCAPRTTALPEGKPILGVIYGVLQWADMNAATPLCNVPCTLISHWGRVGSVMSLVRFYSSVQVRL